MRGDETGRGLGTDSGPGWSRDAVDERIEQKIDAALRSYAEPGEVPEARVVLARVMEEVRASESRRKEFWFWGAAVAAGLAVMVAVGAVWVTRSPRRAEIARAPGVVKSIPQRLKPGDPGGENGRAEAVPVQSRLGAQSELRRNAHPQGSGVARQRVKVAAMLPKQDVFPTPRPLSQEEEALVTFMNRAPAPVKKAVVEDQQHWDDPIIVADLQKPPMEAGQQQNP